MKYSMLKNTDIEVSKICLGTMHYGATYDQVFCFRQMDMFLDYGGNFIDTAHIYNDWVPGELCRSEKVIGRWLKQSKKRDKIKLISKGAHPLLDATPQPRVQKADIQKDLDESLLYLKTDYIDVYFLHRDDPTIPVGEIIDFLDDKVKEGKIRTYACSNWRLNRIKEAYDYALSKGSTGFVCNQLMWSLAEVNVENIDPSLVTMDAETLNFHEVTGVNVMAYSSQGKGYFQRRSKGEIFNKEMLAQYGNNRNDEVYERLSHLSRVHGHSISDFVLQYIMERDFTSVPIVSCDNDGQLIECMKACDVSIKELIQKL